MRPRKKRLKSYYYFVTWVAHGLRSSGRPHLATLLVVGAFGLAGDCWDRADIAPVGRTLEGVIHVAVKGGGGVGI